MDSSVSCREDLLLELYSKMKPKTFSPYDPIAIEGFGQSCLYVIRSGTVILQQERNREAAQVLATLHTGDSFDENWLLLHEEERLFLLRLQDQGENADANAHAGAEARYKPDNCVHTRYVAGTAVLCMCLAKADFDMVVTTYDDSVGAYFASERARILSEAINNNQLSGRDSDSEAWASVSPSSQVCKPCPCGVVGSVWLARC
jgi:signal-transduction protein with cAMP-binding, CBS, and nucleotidyltransferase domain